MPPSHNSMKDYYYEFEQDSTYCYPGSFVLKNKLNLTEADKLEEAERNITALRILELRRHPPKGVMDFRYLCRLHKYIFGDIYDWAGKIRNVNINKGNHVLQLPVHRAAGRLHFRTAEAGVLSETLSGK